MSGTKEEFLKLISTMMNNNFNLQELYPNSENLEVLLEQIEDLKKSLDSFRPLEGMHMVELQDLL